MIIQKSFWLCGSRTQSGDSSTTSENSAASLESCEAFFCEALQLGSGPQVGTKFAFSEFVSGQAFTAYQIFEKSGTATQSLFHFAGLNTGCLQPFRSTEP
jgi:hypothetical protein